MEQGRYADTWRQRPKDFSDALHALHALHWSCSKDCIFNVILLACIPFIAPAYLAMTLAALLAESNK